MKTIQKRQKQTFGKRLKRRVFDMFQNWIAPSGITVCDAPLIRQRNDAFLVGS